MSPIRERVSWPGFDPLAFGVIGMLEGELRIEILLGRLVGVHCRFALRSDPGWA